MEKSALEDPSNDNTKMDSDQITSAEKGIVNIPLAGIDHAEASQKKKQLHLSPKTPKKGASTRHKCKTIVESTGFTQLFFNDQSIPETRKLYRWVRQEYAQKCIEQQEIALQESASSNNITLRELIDTTCKQPSRDEEHTYTIVADLVFIFNDEPITYEACPGCRVQVPHEITNQFTCSNCKKLQSNPITRLKIRATIEDPTDAVNIVLFHRQAETILHEPAETIKNLKKQRNSTALLNEKTEKCLNLPYKFTIKVTDSNYKYIQSRGYTVFEVERIARACTGQEDNIPALLTTGDESATEDSNEDEETEDDEPASMHNNSPHDNQD